MLDFRSVTLHHKHTFLSSYCIQMFGRHLLFAGTPADVRPKISDNEGSLISDASWYRSMAGALQYLTLTRPDIAYAVQQVCLHMHAPRDAHLTLLKRILRYIKGTASLGLCLLPSTSLKLTAYTDAHYYTTAL